VAIAAFYITERVYKPQFVAGGGAESGALGTVFLSSARHAMRAHLNATL